MQPRLTSTQVCFSPLLGGFLKLWQRPPPQSNQSEPNTPSDQIRQHKSKNMKLIHAFNNRPKPKRTRPDWRIARCVLKIEARRQGRSPLPISANLRSNCFRIADRSSRVGPHFPDRRLGPMSPWPTIHLDGLFAKNSTSGWPTIRKQSEFTSTTGAYLMQPIGSHYSGTPSIRPVRPESFETAFVPSTQAIDSSP